MLQYFSFWFICVSYKINNNWLLESSKNVDESTVRSRQNGSMCRAYLVTDKTDDALALVFFVFYSHWKHLTTKEEKSTITSVLIFS